MRQRYVLYAIVFILVLGFGLRVHYLNRPMRFDEALTVMAYANRDLPSISADYSHPNNHILHTMLVHAVLKLVGNHPILVRLPALVAGMLLIPVTYRVARNMYGAQAALLATALVAASPPLVNYSVNARGYTLVALFAMILLGLAHQLKQQDHTGRWLLFAVVGALGFYTMPIMLYPMGIISLWLLVSIGVETRGKERRQRWQNFAVAILLGAFLTLTLYMPVFLFSGIDRLLNNRPASPLPASEFYGQYFPSLFHILRAIHTDWPTVSMVLTLIGFGIATANHPRLSRDRVPLFVPVLGWVLPVLALQRVVPSRRTWLFLTPMYLSVVSAGWVWLLESRRQWQPRAGALTAVVSGVILAGGVLISGNVYQSLETGRADDAEAGAFYLEQVMRPHDVFVASWPTNYPVLYYADIYDLDFTSYEASSGGDSQVYIMYHTYDADEVLRPKENIPELMAAAEVVHRLPNSVILRAPYLGPIERQ